MKNSEAGVRERLRLINLMIVTNDMSQIQEALRNVLLPLSPKVKLFSPKEADAVYREWTYNHGVPGMSDEMPGIHPKLIPLYVMQKVEGANEGVVNDHEPAYQTAYEKIKLYLPMLWNQATLDETVVAQLDFFDKTMVHLLYGVPEERLGLVMKLAPASSR